MKLILEIQNRVNFQGTVVIWMKKILSLNQSRKGCCSQLTKVIYKVNQVILESQNTEPLKVYEYQLGNFLC